MRLPALSSSPSPGSRSTRAGSGLLRAAIAACRSSATPLTSCRSSPPRCSAAGRRRGFRGALCGFWILIGLACASWAAGEALWGVRELGTGSVPFPGGPMPATSVSTVSRSSRWWSSSGRRSGTPASRRCSTGRLRSPRSRCSGGGSFCATWTSQPTCPRSSGSATRARSRAALRVALTPLVAARRGTLAGWLVAFGIVAGGISDGFTHGSWCRTSTRPACGSTSVGRPRRA